MRHCYFSYIIFTGSWINSFLASACHFSYCLFYLGIRFKHLYPQFVCRSKFEWSTWHPCVCVKKKSRCLGRRDSPAQTQHGPLQPGVAATGMRRRGSVPAGGKRAAQQHAPDWAQAQAHRRAPAGSGGALWRRNWAMAPPLGPGKTMRSWYTKSHYTSTRTTTNGPASVPISPALPWSL